MSLFSLTLHAIPCHKQGFCRWVLRCLPIQAACVWHPRLQACTSERDHELLGRAINLSPSVCVGARSGLSLFIGLINLSLSLKRRGIACFVAGGSGLGRGGGARFKGGTLCQRGCLVLNRGWEGYTTVGSSYYSPSMHL